MKRIVNNLLYDTETATLLYEEEYKKRKLYQTPNGNFFKFYNNGEIEPITEESAKDYLGRHAPDVYEEVFGKVENA